MNPPFGDLARVVEKLVEDQGRAILVCPHWPRDLWWKKLQEWVVAELWYPKGTKFFEREGKAVGGTRWGVHAYLVNGTVGMSGRVLNMLETETGKALQRLTTINMFKLGEGHQVVGDEEKRVEVYRAKIKEDFDGAVFGSKVPKDPPVRGLFGEARIDLKEGATPVRQKPFVLHGERLEAHKKVTKDWIENGFIEPIPGGKANAEWLSMTFPVPKKDPRRVARGSGHARTEQHDTASKLPPPGHRGLVGEIGGKPHFLRVGGRRRP